MSTSRLLRTKHTGTHLVSFVAAELSQFWIVGVNPRVLARLKPARVSVWLAKRRIGLFSGYCSELHQIILRVDGAAKPSIDREQGRLLLISHDNRAVVPISHVHKLQECFPCLPQLITVKKDRLTQLMFTRRGALRVLILG